MTGTRLFHVWLQDEPPESASEHWATTYAQAARAEFAAICEGFYSDDNVTRTLLVQEDNSRHISVVECKRTVAISVEMVRSERV